MSDDLHAKLERLRRLQAKATDPDIQADYAERIAELESQLHLKAQRMEGISGNNNKQIIAQNYHEAPPDSAEARAKSAFAQYQGNRI